MIKVIKNHGFSLTEVLIAMVILTTGMVFIAGIFPAAIHLSTISVDRVNASLVAEEAFAKIRLYAQGKTETAMDLTADDFKPSAISSLSEFIGDARDMDDGEESFAFIIEDSVDVFPATEELDPNVFAYPGDDGRGIEDKQYYWSAIMRLTERISDNPKPSVQVTVFICRKVQAGLKYYDPNEFYNPGTFNQRAVIDYPMAVPIEVDWDQVDPERLRIVNDDMKTFINDGYIIVDDETGRIYRVMERLKGDDDNVIVLDRNWDTWGYDSSGQWDDNATNTNHIRVWVVPPPANGNRKPCIAVYQRELEL